MGWEPSACLDWGFGEGDGAELSGLGILRVYQSGIDSSFSPYDGMIRSIGVLIAGTDEIGESHRYECDSHCFLLLQTSQFHSRLSSHYIPPPTFLKLGSRKPHSYISSSGIMLGLPSSPETNSIR